MTVDVNGELDGKQTCVYVCGGHCCSLLTVSSSLCVFSTCVCVCQENMAVPQMWISHITSIQISALLSLCLPTRLTPAPTLIPDLTCSLSHEWQCANMLNAPVGLRVCAVDSVCIDRERLESLERSQFRPGHFLLPILSRIPPPQPLLLCFTVCESVSL